MKPQILTRLPEMNKAETPCSENPDAFYNEKAWETVKAVYCDPCPLKGPCLEEALRSEAASPWRARYGLWAGKTPQERNKIAMKRARLARLKELKWRTA